MTYYEKLLVEVGDEERKKGREGKERRGGGVSKARLVWVLTACVALICWLVGFLYFTSLTCSATQCGLHFSIYQYYILYSSDSVSAMVRVYDWEGRNGEKGHEGEASSIRHVWWCQQGCG